MYRMLFTNRWAALAFVALTVISALVFVGTGDNGTYKIVEQSVANQNARKVDKQPDSAGKQVTKADAAPGSNSFYGDDADQMDTPAGTDPTPGSGSGADDDGGWGSGSRSSSSASSQPTSTGPASGIPNASGKNVSTTLPRIEIPESHGFGDVSPNPQGLN